MSDRLILLDGNNLMHRAYHALPLMDNRPDDARDKPVEGEYTYTNALHGFLMMLFKVMEDWRRAGYAPRSTITAPRSATRSTTRTRPAASPRPTNCARR